jgi:hypothetical protein
MVMLTKVAMTHMPACTNKLLAKALVIRKRETEEESQVPRKTEDHWIIELLKGLSQGLQRHSAEIMYLKTEHNSLIKLCPIKNKRITTMSA